MTESENTYYLLVEEKRQHRMLREQTLILARQLDALWPFTAGKEHRIIAHAADRLHDIGKEVS